MESFRTTLSYLELPRSVRDILLLISVSEDHVI